MTRLSPGKPATERRRHYDPLVPRVAAHQIGGTNDAAIAGINLTSAELAQIETMATGSITIGDTCQAGNITFTLATPATTSGMTLGDARVDRRAGQIILDDGTGEDRPERQPRTR